MRRWTNRIQIAAGVLLAFLTTACGGHGSAVSPIPQSPFSSTVGHSTQSHAHKVLRIRDLAPSAGGAMVPGLPQGYPITADPPVTHPAEQPCEDVLFTPTTPPIMGGQLPVGEFADYSDHYFNYTPPANCPGPYAKIVLKVHFRVSKGVQYDRTGAIWVGGTNIFFGTTAEPSPNASPKWDVERDVTELSQIFTNASVGQASVYNIVNQQYTGIIYGTAKLEFYPATSQYPAGRAADGVYPMASSSYGGYVDLDSATDQLSGTFTFPQNVEKAYLDVFLESQGGDEFWYTCFPNDLAQKLNNCGNTAFREGEVTVDGQPAGVAPVYPWIYSGGIDPYLWVPIPGVETLNFKPYRIDLTPFAAQLDDGNSHTIAVSVFNDYNYFATNATMLVYEDHGSQQVTGALVRDGTSIAPAETVIEKVKFDQNGDAKGTIDANAVHPVSLYGYVITSKGRIDTRVTQSVTFKNHQFIDSTSSEFLQNITQQTQVTSDTQTQQKSGDTKTHEQAIYPLNLNYSYVVNADGSATQTTAVNQTKNDNVLTTGRDVQSSSLLNTVKSSDTLTITQSGFTPSNGKSRQQYKALYPSNGCYDETITSVNYVLTQLTKGC